MATKVPIYLKRGSRKGKKEKLRDILSSDMISPPLGDFRHTIHIGSGGRGDTFGDISFLQGKLHLLPQAEGAAAFEFSRTATISGGQAAAAPSPLLKNAISLPALGLSQALTLPAAPAPPKPPRLHLDEASAMSLPRPRGDNGDTEPLGAQKAQPWVAHEAEPLGAHGTEPWVSHEASATSPPRPRGDNGEAEPLGPHGTEPWVSPEAEPSVSHAGSLLSLHVDLGPSILEDVLQVMERHQAERGGAARPEVLT